MASLEKAGVESEKMAVVGSQKYVVVGVPAFNEEKTIARVIIEAQKHSSKVVVCDDGSTDLTGEIAKRLGADVVKHERNLGYGAAIKSLFKHGRELDADILVTLDADGQHDPREIPVVVKPIIDGVSDVVIGSRFADRHLRSLMPWYRRAGVKLLTRIVENGSKNGVKDAQSGFRAYSRKSLEALDVFEDNMGVSAEILLNARKEGLRICEVPSSCSYDVNLETSSQNPVSHGLNVFVSIVKLVVEDKPLIILGVPGILSLVAGVFFGMWMLQMYSIQHQIETNIALASIAFIMIGFFCLSTSITLYAISRLARKTNGR